MSIFSKLKAAFSRTAAPPTTATPAPVARGPSSSIPRFSTASRKRVGELTVNVQVVPELKRDKNGGEYIALTIPRAAGVASTSDGRYFLRIGDTCQPIVGDDVMRLANERPATPWEEMTSQGVPRANADAAKIASFCARLHASDRVKPSVKEKTDDELLTHYDLAKGDVLTNLGVLLVGGRHDRAGLGSAPIVQAIKYDERAHPRGPRALPELGEGSHPAEGGTGDP